MKNGEWMVKNGYKFRELTCKWCGKTGKYDYDILLNNKCVGKVKNSYSSEAITTWLDMEHEEPILTESERKYLSAVIEPFRNDVHKICKSYSKGYERLVFYGDVCFFLPDFEAGTMYKDMDDDKWYTPEELGL